MHDEIETLNFWASTIARIALLLLVSACLTDVTADVVLAQDRFPGVDMFAACCACGGGLNDTCRHGHDFDGVMLV